MLATFDIFDTCLARRSAVPTDLFRKLARALARIRGEECTADYEEAFEWSRVRGEELARGRSPAGEVLLDEIWRDVSHLLCWPDEPRWAETELRLEDEGLFAVASTLREIQELRGKGWQIAYVSDTYFPRAFIEQVMKRAGFLAPGDGLYLSGEVGTSKASGGLFRHVLRESGMPARSVRHTGDDIHGDGERALAAGIRARIVTPTRFTRVETRLAASQTYGSSASEWAGAMRMSRIHPDAGRMGGGSLLVSQFIGPFVVWYAAWVLEQARRRGIQRLYFVSRDCHMASEVARDLSSELGGIECCYLHVSRQSVLLPTVTEISREALPWLHRSYERGDLAGLLAKLEASDPETEHHWRPLAGAAGQEVTLDDPNRRERFWEILASPSVSEPILARAEERRSGALRYFEEQGLLEAVPSALVDFGWSLTSQWALNRLLRVYGGRKDLVPGFYLQSNFDRSPPAEAGHAVPLFPPVPWDRERSFGAITPHLFANVLEHTAGMADHESVHHYETHEGQTMPCSLSGPIRIGSGGFAERVLRSTVDFARTHRALAVDRRSTSTDATRSRISILLDEVLRNPPRALVEELREIQASADQNHRFPSPIARPLRLRDELPPGFPLGRPGGAPSWTEGSWALTGSGARTMIRAYRALAASLPWELKARIKAAASRGA